MATARFLVFLRCSHQDLTTTPANILSLRYTRWQFFHSVIPSLPRASALALFSFLGNHLSGAEPMMLHLKKSLVKVAGFEKRSVRKKAATHIEAEQELM